MRAVNLLPNESSRASRGTPQPAVLTGAIASVVVVAIVGGGNLLQTSRVASAQRTLNAAKLQLAATPLPPKTPRVMPPPAAVAQQMQPRLAAVSAALSTRIAWDRILREFSLVLPPDIQLSALSLTAPAAGSTGSDGLTLSGLTFSYDSVARLLSRMALIPDLSNVVLANTAIAQNVVSFSINAGIKGAPPAPPAPSPLAPLGATTTTASSPS